MLEKMFKRKDVCDFIEDLFSDSYSNKKKDDSNTISSISSMQQALFTFFDALFKYQVIIETDVFLDEYIVQVRKLFKKLDNFQDIKLGIAKIIGKLCALKLNISDRESEMSKREILQYIYYKYIVEGYFFHGISHVYREQIKEYGFLPEQYQHSYSKFIEIDNIFSKHGITSIMDKSFQESYVNFTDSFMMACYYSANSPMYFYRLLGGNLELYDYDGDAYFRNDYLGCFNNLNKLMKKARLNSYEKKYITKICCDEWKILQRSSSSINVMLVKRKVLGLNSLRDINDILASDADLSDGIYKILNSKSNTIPVGYKLENYNVEFIEIPNYKFLFELRQKQAYDIASTSRMIRSREERISNTYGKVSILILLGSIFITLGVIISILALS